MDLQSSIAKVKKPQNYFDMMPKTPTDISELASAMGDLDIGGRRPHSQSVILGKPDIQEIILDPPTPKEKKPVVPLLPMMYTTQYMQFANLINHTMSEMESVRDKNLKCETEYNFPLKSSMRNSTSQRVKTPTTD